MSLREKINEQFTAALKNKNKTLISTLRLILAAIKERDIANRSNANKEGVKDSEIIKVLRKIFYLVKMEFFFLLKKFND